MQDARQVTSLGKLTSSPRRVVNYFLKTYPIPLVIASVGLLVAGAAEGIGIAMLLPVLGQVTGNEASLPPPLNKVFDAAFDWLGLSPSLEVLLPLMVGLILVQVLVTSCVMIYVGRMSCIASADFRSRIIRAFSSARWSFFVEQPSGGPANALANEVGRVAAGLTAICLLIASVTQAAMLNAAAFLISWEATVAIVLALCISLVWVGWVPQFLRRNNQRRVFLTSSMISRLVNNLSNMKALKAMAVEVRARKLLEHDIAAIRRNQSIGVLLNKVMDVLQEFIRLAAVIGLFVFLVKFRAHELERIFVILVLFMRMMQSLGKVQKQYRALLMCEASFEFVQDLIERAEAVQEKRGGDLRPSLDGELCLVDVGFAYDEKPILDGVNIRVPAGSLACFTGPSGAGKTTLLDIVCGLIRPQRGEVFVDGVPLSSIDLRAWRQQIGYVPQEIILFPDTLLANVTLGDVRISETEVEEALRMAGAWEFATHLGLHTRVGEQGMRFSGGQRQRIALARALVRRPRLLILDEMTSSLDSATEQEICQMLAALRNRVTIMASSHRPALVSIADLVYQCDGGSVKTVLTNNVGENLQQNALLGKSAVIS